MPSETVFRRHYLINDLMPSENIMTPIFTTLPTCAELLHFLDHYQRIAIAMPQHNLAQLQLSPAQTSAEQALYQQWQQQIQYTQFHAVNILRINQREIWLMPSESLSNLADYFSDGISWQYDAIAQNPSPALKAWYHIPSSQQKPQHIAVIGAGIAGAATARVLAEEGVRVSVLESHTIAHAGSGNQQGLLYAKISPHNTEQTELLLGGYAFTRRLLDELLPDSNAWQACGVLHLNHNETERKRNHALALQTHHQHLYHAVNHEQASELAGISIEQDGLFWPHGAWLNPLALVRKLLSHPLIEVFEHTPLQRAQWTGEAWQLHTPQQNLLAEHIVYCTGAGSAKMADLQDFSWQMVRGQTTLAQANHISCRLKIALSGASYISPAWQQQHCFGAVFIPNDDGDEWREMDDETNFAELSTLHPTLAHSFSDGIMRGHSAVRCDAPDHLPTVGALGNGVMMKQLYAKLAHDKNYRLNAPCPFIPNAWVNAAHGSRGLATAPWCAKSLVAMILGKANPLSPRLRQALHPNRHIIRAIIRGHEYGGAI